MKKLMLGVFCVVFQVSLGAVVDHSSSSAKATADMPNPVLTSVSRQCIKIWCLIRNLVENKADLPDIPSAGLSDTALAESDIEHLDTLLCRVMKVRDTLSHYGTNPISDTQTAEYIDSSLDCIGQYTHDLVEQYPGSWSTIIQEQVFRTQEAYAQHLLPLLTK
jgi:hypothetical protein